MAAPKFADFADLEAEVKAYLSTLDETALNDPAAPSPLAYLELQSAGRADLAEGCMKHGGYLAVSTKLGVRIQRKQAGPEKKAANIEFDSIDPYAVERLDGGSGARTLSREEQMAADLVRLKAKGPEAKGDAAPTLQDYDRLSPMKLAGASSAQAARPEVKAEPGFTRYLRLDTFQRATALLLAVLLAAGFGSTSHQVLNDGTIGGARLAAAALGLAHMGLAGYGTLLAAQAENEDPVLWALKLLITGPGGFAELKSSLNKPSTSA